MSATPLPNGCIGEPANPPNPDHDAKGRFVKGNRGGPGNPHARQVAALRKRLLDYLTPERMDQLTEQLFKQAMGGDLAAAKLLLGYTIGSPSASVDPDKLDLQELELLRSAPHINYVLRDEIVPAALAVAVQRVLQAVSGEAAVAKGLRTTLKHPPALPAALQEAGLDNLAGVAQAQCDKRAELRRASAEMAAEEAAARSERPGT